MNIQSILWIFLTIYSSVFPLHGNILCIFFVFVGIFLWHVKFKCVESCSSSATIYELRAHSTLPLDGAALLAAVHLASHCLLYC
jgi:hypothetical protein